MPAELLASVAAICFASGSVIVKLATRNGSVLQGFVIGLAVNALVVGVFAALTLETWEVAPGPVAFFALAGLAGPGAARLLMMRSVRDVGASVAVPVQASCNPLLASAAGIVLFDETARPARLVAVALIITGIWACTRGGSANRVPVAGAALSSHPSKHSLLLLALPLAAGAAFASSDVLRKAGLTRGGDPVLGALVGTAVALSIWLAVLVLTPRLRAPVAFSPSLGWFCLNGVLIAIAQLALLFALSKGELSVVSPIVASQPVIVVILGALVLRDLERARVGTALGAGLVFLGVVLLSTT